MRINIEDLDFEDKEVWDMISEGKVKGCFQIEGYLGKSWCQRIKPHNLLELAAVISLIRPGCVAAKVNGKTMTERYADRKDGCEDVVYMHDSIEDILKETYGVIVYQEQSMQIAEKMAGFSLKEADNLRKAIGKKDAKLMGKVRSDFISGCINNGIDEEKAKEVFDIIQESQRYGFNKCVSGKEVIKKAGKGSHTFNPSVEEMYKIRNDIEYAKTTGHLSLYKKWKLLGHYGSGHSLNSDGRVRPNIIKDIIYQGRRETLTIHLSGGKTITTTDNHKFPTLNGVKLAGDITVRDELYVCGDYEMTDFKPITKFSNSSIDDRFHANTYKGSGFPNGKNNPSYTNGGFTSFKKFKNETDDVCNICKSVKNIETDHIDRDRTNNSWDNLQKLCSSCHKKKEYSSGRTRRGEKGYPSYTLKVLKVVKNGEEDVYDVTMNAPNHNFVMENGIVTCNSHAVGYAQVTYWTAWLKRHYLDKYFKNWLRNSDDKQDTDTERHQLITAAKAEGLEINGPSMKYPFENFIKRDDKLYFGACNVKSVGKAHLEKYINLINDWDGLPTWVEFVVIILPQINKKAVENLIKVGFFSGLGYSRSQMLHDFSCIKQLTKLELSGLSDDIDSTNRDQPLPLLLNSFLNKGLKKDGGHVSGANRLVKVQEIVSRLENPGRELSDNPAMYARMEEKLLGCAVSTSELDSCAKASHADSTCLEVSDGKKGKCTVACIIKRVMEHTTKNDETMAFIAIEDNSGELEDIVIFPDVYSQNKDIIFNESTVLLTGEAKISKNRKSFIVDNMFSI